MPHTRRQMLRIAAAAASSAVLTRAARAETYPSRPVRFIIPFSAGGTTDTLGRLLGNTLSERLGQQVVIENKPGGGTNIAVQSVVKSPPDGYTLLMTLSTNTINPWLYKSLPFDFQHDIVAVSGLAEQPLVLDVHPDVPAKTVAEFIAYAKANPGKVRIASFGARTISHLAIELIKSSTGIDVIHVPYPGGAPMLTDMIGRRIEAGVDALPNSLPHIRAGAVRALAVLSKARSPAVPEVPTVEESIAGLEVASWIGVGAPKDTPADIVERLNRDINASLADPGLTARYAEIGAAPLILTPAQASEKIATDMQKWRTVVERAGLKPSD
jgi:tripartite-type tricarboxylate transporter receptor subunit TctC